MAPLKSHTKSIMVAAGFEGPVTGPVAGDVTGAVTFPTYTFAQLPAAASSNGKVVYCSNGSAGQPCMLRSDGTNWKVIAIGANAASS